MVNYQKSKPVTSFSSSRQALSPPLFLFFYFYCSFFESMSLKLTNQTAAFSPFMQTTFFCSYLKTINIRLVTSEPLFFLFFNCLFWRFLLMFCC